MQILIEYNLSSAAIDRCLQPQIQPVNTDQKFKMALNSLKLKISGQCTPNANSVEQQGKMKMRPETAKSQGARTADGFGRPSSKRHEIIYVPKTPVLA